MKLSFKPDDEYQIELIVKFDDMLTADDQRWAKIFSFLVDFFVVHFSPSVIFLSAGRKILNPLKNHAWGKVNYGGLKDAPISADDEFEKLINLNHLHHA